MFKANLRGQIRQTSLPKWKPLLPLCEAVMNAFQAVQDAPAVGHHKIKLSVSRDSKGLFEEDTPPICGFSVADSGIGFNQNNFDSFNTSYSDYKAHRGGKGLGRFVWLKAFDHVEIESVYFDPEAEVFLQRKFVFDENYSPSKGEPKLSQIKETGTKITLCGFREPYKSQCPKLLEQVALRIIEHFILVFMTEGCPIVELKDGEYTIILNKVFEAEFKAASTSHPFKVGQHDFKMHGFRLSSARVSKHKLIYAANDRAVRSDNLEDFIPNLNGRLPNHDGTSFVYLAVVQGQYLNQHVNNFRTDFDLDETDDCELELGNLFVNEVRRSHIRDACLGFVSKDLSNIIVSINEQKEERILKFIHEEAPQYRILMKYKDEFIDKISPNATRSDLDTALHKELHNREVKLKQEGSRIIRDAEKIDNYETYQARLSDFVGRYNELGVSALAQYVAHRKIILDFLDRAISVNPDSNKYPLEKVVHNLIFPMRTTSDDLPYMQQNLWIIDERLTYHSFVASDIPITSIDHLESDSIRRPDVVIFDRKMMFTEGDQPLNSITIIEFKRPQRDDYTADDNPLSQCFATLKEIRAGRFRDGRKRPVPIANQDIPAYCYVVCDITPTFRSVLEDSDADITPDNQGFYGYHRRNKCYFEVIDYEKLLRDARKRNRIFFDKLNIIGTK